MVCKLFIIQRHYYSHSLSGPQAEPKWRPHMPVFASCAPGSATDMANQRGKLTSRNVMTAAAQGPPSADGPLQKPVDPKLLVTTSDSNFQGTTCPSSASCEERQTEEGTLRSFFIYNMADTSHNGPTYTSSLPGRLRHRSRFNSRSSATRDLPVVALRPSPRPPARARSRKALKVK
jgi:hypothetical protein